MEHLAVAAARCLSERLHSMLNQSQGLRLAITFILLDLYVWMKWGGIPQQWQLNAYWYYDVKPVILGYSIFKHTRPCTKRLQHLSVLFVSSHECIAWHVTIKLFKNSLPLYIYQWWMIHMNCPMVSLHADESIRYLVFERIQNADYKFPEDMNREVPSDSASARTEHRWWRATAGSGANADRGCGSHGEGKHRWKRFQLNPTRWLEEDTKSWMANRVNV